MGGIPWAYASELRLVFHLSELRAPHDGIEYATNLRTIDDLRHLNSSAYSIVVIPGLWAQDVLGKENRQCTWLKLLVASTDNDTRVFVFRYDIEPREDGVLWHQLLGLGKVLLDAIRQVRPFEVRTASMTLKHTN